MNGVIVSFWRLFSSSWYFLDLLRDSSSQVGEPALVLGGSDGSVWGSADRLGGCQVLLLGSDLSAFCRRFAGQPPLNSSLADNLFNLMFLICVFEPVCRNLHPAVMFKENKTDKSLKAAGSGGILLFFQQLLLPPMFARCISFGVFVSLEHFYSLKPNKTLYYYINHSGSQLEHILNRCI